MTTPDTTANAEAEATTSVPEAESQESEGIKQLRERGDRAVAELQETRAELLEVHVRSIGLDPTTGLGVAMMESFDIKSEKPTAEAVAAFAQSKYGHAAPGQGQPQSQVPAGVPNPAAEAMQQQQEAAAFMEGTQQVVPENQGWANLQEADARFENVDPTNLPQQRDIHSGIAAKMNAR